MALHEEIVEKLIFIEDKIAEENARLSNLLLHMGFNQEKELAEIDEVSAKIRAYVKLGDKLLSRLGISRDIVLIPKYHYLHKLSPKTDLKKFFKKLSGMPLFAEMIWDEDCVVALEKLE